MDLTERRIEAGGLEAGYFGCGVGFVCVVKGLEGRGEGEPESTEAAEDDEGKGVAKNPLCSLSAQYLSVVPINVLAYLSKSTSEHAETAEEKVDTSASRTAAASATPAHQVTGQRC